MIQVHKRVGISYWVAMKLEKVIDEQQTEIKPGAFLSCLLK